MVWQQVVPLEAGTGDGRSVIQTSMRAMPVVLMEPAWQFDSALLRVVVSTSVGPFPQRGLDEAFGFAIGARGGGQNAGECPVAGRGGESGRSGSKDRYR